MPAHVALFAKEPDVSADHRQASHHINRLLEVGTTEQISARLSPKLHEPTVTIPGGSAISAEAVERRWQNVPGGHQPRGETLDEHTAGQLECYNGNIENFIGTVKIP